MANVYSLKGDIVGEVKLPDVFDTEYRPDLIQRAVVSVQANKRQVYGTYRWAGLHTSADYFGRRRGAYRMTINRGQSRLPREKPGAGGLGKVRKVPQSVGGRRAHPPHGKDLSKKMNSKESMAALNSAIAATKDKSLVLARGHSITNIPDMQFPIIVEDSFEKLNKTKDIIKVLNSLGLGDDLIRARNTKVRAGSGKMRGRKYKRKKSVLIVINRGDKGSEEKSKDSTVNKESKVNKEGGVSKESKLSGIELCPRNIPGVDVVCADKLNIELLAPGTHPGRLTIWTKSAIENLGK